ncbi:MAG: Gmad2 immunoglobulin-like domain-containing protein [Actinomycetota bacterium]
MPSLQSGDVLVTPRAGDLISSPLLVEGREIGFEGTINVRLLDDRVQMLHPTLGVLMGGAMEPAPFSGYLEFEHPNGGTGILILTGSQGASGPVPDQTIVRVRFRDSR